MAKHLSHIPDLGSYKLLAVLGVSLFERTTRRVQLTAAGGSLSEC
jgi:hypothetical protein